MFCQHDALATLLPPNFITIHGASTASDAEAIAVTGTQWQCRWKRRARRLSA
jgi:hypothetical protein